MSHHYPARQGQASDIVLIEDNSALARLYSTLLSESGYTVSSYATGQLGLDATLSAPPRLLLLDLELPDQHGFDVLRQVRSHSARQPVAMLTCHSSVSMAVEAMRLGAQDFIEKPIDIDTLGPRIRGLLDRLSAPLPVAQNDGPALHALWGRAPCMQQVFERIRAAARSEAPVFITGESGTGKELCAEAIHHLGSRAGKPFVAVNCGAIPRELFESELFGHERGAFSGAIRDRKGLVEQAAGGTLFLDEIGELELEQQVKLLRFVQTGEFRRVGDTQTRRVELRIVCATHRDPLARMQAGQFREDLYYRLHVIPLHLPPLRERGDDVLLIAERLLMQQAAAAGKGFQDFAPEVRDFLRQHPWPGNVRQLQNLLRGVVALYDGDCVQMAMLGERARAGLPAALCMQAQTLPPLAALPVRPLWQTERDAIEAAIAHCDGNVPLAAAQLEVSASTLYRKRKEWEAMGL